MDDTNKSLVDMCSFRDEWLYGELQQHIDEKADMLLHDPLMQLSKPKEVEIKTKTVGGTYKKRMGRRNRTMKKNKW